MIAEITKNNNAHVNYRPDIDGLRAIAILLVIIFHAFPKFIRGGFIGVDIFFVISGYLITTIILKGQTQGNFSLFAFYSRRIKRIFPSLILVLSFCLITGWYILLSDEYEFLGKHIAAGSLYLSNFVLKSESGYFDVDAELKPLLHLWSLSIEEQFYLVFPLLLLIGGRLKLHPLAIVLFCLTASFLLNVTKINDDATEVFFYPHTRAWELLIGSVVAYINLHFRDGIITTDRQTDKFALPLNTKQANYLAYFGFLLIALLPVLLWLGFKILFPSWWALAPTIGAACLILADDKAWFNRTVLASKPLVFIGLISYPLYLWHWVLLSFLRITEIEKPKTLLLIAVLVMSVFLAGFTYFFIEKNVRFSKNKFVGIGLLAGLFLIGFLGYFIENKKGFPMRFEHNDTMTHKVNDQTLAKEVPKANSCVEKYSNADFCLIQDSNSSPTALLIGDSHSAHLYPGLVINRHLTNGNLLNLGVGDCFPFFDNPIDPNSKCRPFINQALEMAIKLPSIKTVILAGRAISAINEDRFLPKKSLSNYFSNSETAEKNDPYTLFENGMKKTLQRLSETNKTIIFVLDTPDLEFEPKACFKRPWRLIEQTKTPCAVARPQVDSRRQKYLAIVKRIVTDFPHVKIWDPLPVLCDNSYCWAIKEGMMLYADSHHLSKTGAIYLGAYLARRYAASIIGTPY